MRVLFRTLILLALSTAAGTAHGQSFYYGTDGPIATPIDSLKIMLKFNPAIPVIQRDAILDSIGRIEQTIPSPEAVDEFMVCSLQTGSGYEDFLDSVQAIPEILFAEPFYLLEDGNALYIGQSFCAAFNEDLSAALIDSINALHHVTVARELQGMPNVYLLLNSTTSGYRTLELANTYHTLPEIRYAHPNFGMRIRKTAYKLFDYYSAYQPHTKKVIGGYNTASVWDFAGLDDAVTVAVIDDGVDSHEDLPATRVLPGYDFADGGTDATPGPKEAHGMGCAGIIGASHTTDSLDGALSSSGTISLSPRAKILPVNIFGYWGDPADNPQVVEAVTYAYTHGADILSCSWGYNSAVYDYPALTEALERATLFGRNGRGCAVIFASGNGAYSFPGVLYPANLPFCVAVGATQLDDSRWWYSSYGSALDIVAPSGDVNLQGDVWTFDQMGNLGYNPTYISNCPPGSNDVDYDCRFGGTSAACPVVSGTASLLLARDSTLNASAVSYILRNSAVTNLDWGAITPPHNEYGYGRVDAFRAVLSLVRGDVNNDTKFNVSDCTHLIAYLFRSGPSPFPSPLLGDVNCDGSVAMSDLTYLIAHLFRSGPAPVRPCFEYGD